MRVGSRECGVLFHAKNENQQWCCQAFLKKALAVTSVKGAFKSHILTKMTTKRKRQLRGTSMVTAADQGLVKRMLRD